MDPERLMIRGVAYWGNLVGLEAVANKATVRVRMPMAQRFTNETLTRMIEVAPQRMGAPGTDFDCGFR
jgi:hypothetical protein